MLATLVFAGAAAGTQPQDQPTEGTPPAAAEQPQAQERTIQFTFKETPLKDVIFFFSRATNLPVIEQVPPPDGTLTYLAPNPYTFDEAFSILNIILQTRGVTLRREGDFLYLGKFDKASPGPTYVAGEIPGDVSGETLVTVLVPLQNITAQEVSERLAPLVGSYGGFIPLPQQNTILLTETAAQCRRLQSIISTLDEGGDYKDQVRIFPVRNAKARDLLGTLKILMSERIVKYVINQQGEQVKLEEDDLAGLRMESDDRTNAIISKGPTARLETLEQMIAMLDVPATAPAGGEMTTIPLYGIDSAEAGRLLNQLFASKKPEERPTIVPLPEVNKITVVGPAAALMQAVTLIQQVDEEAQPEGMADRDLARTMSVIPLQHASPDAVRAAVAGLLTPRQQRLVRVLPSPDGRSLILAGPQSDASAVRDLVEALDVPADQPREIRLVDLGGASADAPGLIERTTALYGRQVDAESSEHRVDVEYDAESGVMTLIGSRDAVARWQGLFAQIESTIGVQRETRRFTLLNAEPSEIAPTLTSLSARMLTPTATGATAAPFAPPVFVAVDEMDLLIATAQPAQWAVIENLVETLDEPGPRDVQFRVISSLRRDPQSLADEAAARYAEQTETLDEDLYGPVQVEVDSASGSLLLTGSSQGINAFTAIVSQLQQITPPARETRFVQMRQASAADVLARLESLLAQADPIDPAREVPPPTFAVMPETNGLLVTAEPAQHRMIAELAGQLDVPAAEATAPLRLLQLRTANAEAIATMLTRQFDQRGTQDRLTRPVTVQADPATNTLIVSAHEELFEEIKALVSQLNEESMTQTDRVTEIFTLQTARASDLAAALERLFPDPPMPLDRRGQPMPWARGEREVRISFDQNSNSIIVDAPAERMPAFQALVEKLDRIELAADAQLRTYSIQRADLNTIVATLNNLAQSGALGGAATAGRPRVPVSITAEPTSRTLIVTGDEQTFAKVEDLLEDLQEVPVERRLQVLQVTNMKPSDLAARATAIYEEQTRELPDARPVEVQADDDSGTLMVIADELSLGRFTSIINQLQESLGPGQEVRLRALEHAEAADVVEFLRDLAETSRSFRSSTPGPAPLFEPIERTNSVMIAAQPAQLPIIEALISELDVVEDQELPPVRLLSVETADAENLATTLSQVYDSRPAEQRALKPVSLRADPQTNTLLVSAHPEPFAEIQSVVEELNRSRTMDRSGREIRIFPLRIARAEELAQTLDQMFPEPPIPVDSRGRPMPQIARQREVIVRADSQTNSLIVDAPVERLAGFEQLVEQLDAAEIPTDAQLRTWQIRHADLDAVRQTLAQLASSGALAAESSGRPATISISVEPMSRTLIVAGPQSIFARVEEVLAEMDAQPDRPATVLRFFRLEHARSDALAPLLRDVLIARMEEDLASETTLDVSSLLEVTSDAATNTLIINAPASMIPIVEQLLQQLDDEVAAASDSIIRILPLTFAEADAVATTLNETVTRLNASGRRRPLAVNIVAAAGSNALVLVGAERDLAEVEELIAPLDARPALDALAAQTFPLRHAEASKIADVVERLLMDQQEMDPRVQLALLRSRDIDRLLNRKPPIRVEADTRTNTLIVSAPQQTLALATTLIEQLDVPDPQGQREVGTFTPHRSDAAALAGLVRGVIEETTSRSQVEIIANPQAGVVVVLAPADELDRVMGLLREFDQQTPAVPVMDLQVFALQYLDAAQLTSTLTPILRDTSRWPEELRRAVRAGIVIAQPTVSPDASANRVLVSAPADLMDLARQVIGQLDQPRDDSQGATELRVFNLQTADAERVASSLSQTMAVWSANRGERLAPSISAEASTNSVVVAATPEQMSEIESLIEPLESGTSLDQPHVRTVFLAHARAESVAPIVTQLLAGEQFDQWIRFTAIQRGMELPDSGPDVRVVPEPRLNAVIVSAPASVLDMAEEMIRQLDADPNVLDPSRQRKINVIALTTVDAAQVAQNLEAIFSDPQEGDVQPPVIRVDAETNSLIVRATDAQYAMIEEVIESLQGAAMVSARQMQVIPVDRSRATAAQTAETIRRLLQQQEGAGAVEIITIDELLRRETAEPDDADDSGSLLHEVDLLPPTISPWERLQRELLFAPLALQEQSEEETAEPPAVTIAIDEATNSLVVVGSPFLTRRIADLVAALEEQIPALPEQIRYIALEDNANAGQIASLINSTLNNLRQRPNGLSGQVAVIADPSGPGLIVSANDLDFKTVGSLIAALSRPAPGSELTIRIYPVTSMTAQHAQAAIDDLLNVASGGAVRRPWQAQRVRELMLSVETNGEASEPAAFDPMRVSVTTTPGNDALIVIAPPESLRVIDRYIALLDQTPTDGIASIRQFAVRHAESSSLAATLQRVFDARFQAERAAAGPGARASVIRPTIAADDRTNMLLVTGREEHFEEVSELLATLDAPLAESVSPLTLIELDSAVPSRLKTILDQVVIGADPGRRDRIVIVPDDPSRLLMVRAPDEDMELIREIVADIDRVDSQDLPIRAVKLERSDADRLAQTLQRFFEDRARISQQPGQPAPRRRISIVGDTRSSSIFVAADDEDFAEIERLVEIFDTPSEQQDLRFQVIPLKHARAQDVEIIIDNMAWTLTYDPDAGNWGGRSDERGKLAISSDERTNSVIVSGSGENFELIESIVRSLDVPAEFRAARDVKVLNVKFGDVDLIARAVEDAFGSQQQNDFWFWYYDESQPDELRVIADERNKLIIASGGSDELEQVAAFVERLDQAAARPDQMIRILALEHGRADAIATSLNRFFTSRSRAANLPDEALTITPAADANKIVVSATEDQLLLIEDLLRQLDVPAEGDNRRIELYVLEHGKAAEALQTLRQLFPIRGAAADQHVIVTADSRTNSLVVSAPDVRFAEIEGVITMVDSPPAGVTRVVKTFSLQNARASEVVTALNQTFDLLRAGGPRGGADDTVTRYIIERQGDDPNDPNAIIEPIEIEASVTANSRSNALIVTATAESIPVISRLIQELDQAPAVPEREYRIVKLQHAVANEVWGSLTTLLARRFSDARDTPAPAISYSSRDNSLAIAATPDQHAEIMRLIEQIDKPSDSARSTEFVTLDVAQAEKVADALRVFYGRYALEADTPGKRNVSIVADPATNSLVVTADETEWEGVRALIAKLDTEAYDATLRLDVFALQYADSQSVAAAINQAFAPEVAGRGPGGQGDQGRGGGPGSGEFAGQDEAPRVLVDDTDLVRAASEPVTNSVVVSASRRNMEKIATIIDQLDVADYAKLPPVRLIPLVDADAESLAESLRATYADVSARGGAGRASSRRSVLITADKTSNTIIVRAEPEEFAQIMALAQALEQTSGREGLQVRVLPLQQQSAVRIVAAVQQSFAATAAELNEPFTIQADVAGNSLIVASSARLFEQIREVVSQLDSLGPGGNQQILIVPVEHVAPEEMKRILESLQLDRSPVGQGLGMLSEPVRITILPGGKPSLAILVSPGDRERLLSIIASLDAAPQLPEAEVRLVELSTARAEAVVAILRDILNPAEQHVQNPLADSLREQVRRLRLHRSGEFGSEVMNLDLTMPIRVSAAPGINGVLITSTPENCAAMEEITRLFDKLPLTEAVSIRLFPLTNMSATMMRNVVSELFQQGRNLARQPGSEVSGKPASEVGGALIDQVAMTVDERTNTLIVAGREASVALVEVLISRLDSESSARWIEPRLIQIKHADAVELAETLDAVIVQGRSTSEQDGAIQRQVGRLRVTADGGKISDDPEGAPQSDFFVPLSRLVIRPDSQLNALLVVGTPDNIEIVTALVAQLDIPAAAPDAAVRVYALNHGSAGRVAQVARNLFDQQVQSGAIRDEDRLIISADERTNSVIVTTSARSFAVFESLLNTLDSPMAMEMHEIRTIRLSNTSASLIAPVIQRLMDSRLERLRRVEPETAELQQATIIAEPRSNALLVAAGNESYEVVERLAASLDAGRGADLADVTVIPLQSANVAALAQTLDEIFERQYADLPQDLAQRERPLILTDTRSNSLLVAASPADLDRVKAIVARLEETPLNPAVGLHVIALSNNNASTLAPRIQTIMREREQALAESGRAARDRTVIQADEVSNSLIIAASDENLQVIRGLITTLDREQQQARADEITEIIMVRSGNAQRLLDLLNELYVERANEERGTGTVRVTADESLNAVVVSAPAADVEQIRGLVAELESAQVTDIREIKVIALKAANAAETVSLLQNVLESGRRTGARDLQSTIVRFIREKAAADLEDQTGQPPTETEITTAIREAIRLTPDLRTNSIIVSAPSSSLRLITELVDALDSSDTGSKRVRIFTLVNADAIQMSQILADLFNLQQAGNLYVLRPRDVGIPGGEPGAQPDPSTVVGAFGDVDLITVPDERQQLSITVDARTNSLLVSGTPTYLEIVADVVNQLDSMAGASRIEQVVALKNARAEEVATALNTFLTQEQERILRTLGPERSGSLIQQLEREVSVVGVPESNSLMVSASPRYLDKINAIISELDNAPPQVLISVMFAEVTLDTDDQWGMDFSVGPLGGSDVTGGSSFGIASGSVSGLGVPNLSVSADDFSLLIRSLQAQGRVEVLSRPVITVNNNEVANFQVGQDIGIVSNIQITDTGNSNASVERQQIGIILDVEPSISPDRFVRMAVRPEISSLSARTTQISEDFDSPIIDKRTIETVVTVRDGQTVVIGGLFSNRTESRKQKVPFLGDIPFIGAPFRTSLMRREKTELLVVITPHVITTPGQNGGVDTANELTREEVDNLTLPQGTREQLLDGQIDQEDWYFDLPDLPPTDRPRRPEQEPQEEQP